MAPRPSGPHLTQRLRTLALTSPPKTALFYARLYRALFPPTDSEHDSLHVLALCHIQCGNLYPALGLVRDLADADADPSQDIPDYENGIPARRPGCYGCAVIVAKCCTQLSRFTEGRQVLDRAVRRSVPMTLPTPCPAETAATASLLLATVSHKGKAPAQAVECYTRALADDPWLWEAFTGLCDVGAPPAPDTVFPDPPSLLRASSNRTSRHATLSPGPMPRSSASEVPNFARRQMSPLAAQPTTSLFTPEVSGQPSRVTMMGNISSWDTPSTMADTTFPTIQEHQTNGNGNGITRRPLPNLISQFIPTGLRATPTVSSEQPASKPPALKRPRGAHVMRNHPIETPVGRPLAAESRLNREIKAMETNGDKLVEPPVRRSSRLTSSSKGTSRTARDKRSTRSQSVTSSASGQTETSPATLEAQTQAAVDDWLRDILRRCARAYRALSLFQTKEALLELDSMPKEVQSSPWAVDLAARCFYEAGDYIKGRRAFKRLIEAEPYGMASMEWYSTLLWHLNDTTALSALSQNLLSISRDAPQAWMAAGNTFALLQKHDEAMRCFRRATQLAPGEPYAWTLCGHEAYAMEETDRAVMFYRKAVQADARHYPAWFGLGRVYTAQGKARHAEHHFRRAAEINPQHPVLLCCLGGALEDAGDLVGALGVFERAAALGVDAVLPHFRRVRVLVAMGRIGEAITALESLVRGPSADEANVHLMLGKCYLRAGRSAEAVVALTHARELQPKFEGAIRQLLLSGGQEEEAAE